MLCPVCNTSNPGNNAICRSCGATLNVSSSTALAQALPVGIKLQGSTFSVGKVLGQGGFGITYLGSDVRLRRSVAIKEFFPTGCVRQGNTVYPTSSMTAADYQSVKDKFLEEARILAQFQHPGIVRVYNSFEENNTAYMVMEYLKGKTLLKLVEDRGSLRESEAVDYVERVGEALEVMHQANLLHRDIKPENVILTEDARLVLVDFGTAREFAAGRTKRMTTTLTPGYAPLEQYGQQARFGAFTDIYALGAMLYHLLTGQVPIQATDRAVGVGLTPPHQVKRNLSRVANEAVMWAMEMKVSDRPQSVREFLVALRGQSLPKRLMSKTKTAATATNPFKFKSGEAFSIIDLVKLCDKYWDEAEDYLFNGYLESWLGGSLGEAAIAKEARGIVSSYANEKRKGLELFVRELCKKVDVDPYPNLVAQPSRVDFGRQPVEAKVAERIRLKNLGRGFAWGSVAIEPNLSGVSVTSKFDGSNDQLEIQLDTRNVLPGKYRSQIVIKSEAVPANSQICQVPLKYKVVPAVTRWNLVAKWTVGVSIATGAGMGICRGILASMAPELNHWFLSYKHASNVRWAGAIFGVFVIGLIAGTVGIIVTIKLFKKLKKSLRYWT